MSQPTRPHPVAAPEHEAPELDDLAPAADASSSAVDESSVKGGALREPALPPGVPIPYPNRY